MADSNNATSIGDQLSMIDRLRKCELIIPSIFELESVTSASPLEPREVAFLETWLVEVTKYIRLTTAKYSSRHRDLWTLFAPPNFRVCFGGGSRKSDGVHGFFAVTISRLRFVRFEPRGGPR